MEVEYKSGEESYPESNNDEQLESSATDDSSGVYPYYPHIDFMNPASTQKVRSRLGKRRTTLNPFRISKDVKENLSVTNNSNNSAEDSCSDVISRSITYCPALSEKGDYGIKSTKNMAALDQENCPAPPSSHIIERHGFRNVSSSINSSNFKSNPFFQEKSSTVDTNKTDNIQDTLYVPKTEQKLTNVFNSTNSNQTYKTPLKQMTDNIFSGSATKVNYSNVHQSNPAKNLFGSKFTSDVAKENALNSFDCARNNKKPREVFSSSLQNEKNGPNVLKKFESQSYVKVKQSETQLSHKGLSKATSLDDLPLDLKLKFRTEKTVNEQIFSNSNEERISKITEIKREPVEIQRPKLNIDIDSRVINILEMPSVRRMEESPARPIHSSFSTVLPSSNLSANQFKEPAVPVPKRQTCSNSPQESTDSGSYSVLNLSMDNCVKTSNQINSSVLENKNSQANQLNTTDINTASFIPNSNSSFLMEAENASKRGNQNDSSCISSGSEGNSSSLSQNISARNTTSERSKVDSAYPKQGTDEVHAPSQVRAPPNLHVAPNVSLPSAFHRNSNPVSFPSNKSVSNVYPQPESLNDARMNDRVFNAEKRFPEKENMFGKNPNSAVLSSDQKIKQVERNVPLVFPNAVSVPKPFETWNAETEKNIFKSNNKENESFENGSKPAPEPKPLSLDTKTLAQEIFKKPSSQILPIKTTALDPFKKPTQPLVPSVGGSGIPVAVSQPSIINPNFVLPKVNPRPSKPYSFASDAAKFCQKEGGTKLTLLKNPQVPTSSNVQSIKVNNRSYHILSTIGRGGSSEVYQVLDPTNKTLLAVKVVKLAAVDESIAEGYMNEVELLEKLQGCFSVIRMFDYEHMRESKKLYVVMEKGDTDLSRLLKDINKTKKISMSMIIYYWTEMLTAVQEIHEKGIIHSDLKPANFLLVSGRLKLIDFGIASSLQGDMTSVHKDICAGTENYMSPEAIQDGTNNSDKKFKISYKSDVWSLGCILYNLIYGKTPFSHITSRWGKMYAIISSSHKIDFPDHPMPPVLRHALQSCLIRDPKQRPTVKELLDLPYHTPALSKDLPFKIQQILPEEWWEKIAHLFSEPMKPISSQRK